MKKKNIVVVGGGTGNRTTLTGLKDKNCNLSAVVAMTDSGGSSGRLRDELGQLPPGDIRQCLIALSDETNAHLMSRLFEYRFRSGYGLAGHNFGNLILTALTEVTGNTVTAIDAAAQLLGVKGQVLPVTLTRSDLVARLDDGTELSGESVIDLRRENLTNSIDYIRLEPPAYAHPPVLEAINQADAIILGPGDIYTSVIPNLLVQDVAEAIVASKAIKIHVCNLMTKPGESDDFKASDFAKLLMAYLGTSNPLDYLIFNDSPYPERLLQRYALDGQHPVELDKDDCLRVTKNIVEWPLLASGVYLRHEPSSLGRAIMSIINSYDGTLPLVTSDIGTESRDLTSQTV